MLAKVMHPHYVIRVCRRSAVKPILAVPCCSLPCIYALLVLQVWTFNDRVAFVLSVTENGQPVQDGMKLQRLRQLLFRMMDEQGTGIVSIKKVGHFVQVARVES